ncbi:MAG: hypothetical protein LUH09_06765 [Clostridiales bacterium]|nr:hypothetical protein [Clostridiales bacterium]MCD7753361.1 hypothetical protein [Clostridiales bacterium]MCD7802582.1 hypothetical protein [Clostridiales bacterium]
MKRIKFACLSQTVHFERNEKLGQEEATRMALLERERYLKRLEETGTAYCIDQQYQLEDGTPVLVLRRQYNSYATGDYLN